MHLMMLVNEKKVFTVRELTRELGVSRRTILRDLMELGELGVPLYSETGASGGYRVLREKILPPISFTEDEAIALFFAAQSLQNYKTLPFDVQVRSALDKFYFRMSPDIRGKIDRLKTRLSFWVPSRDTELPYLKPLLEASIDPTIVDIGYDSKSGPGTRRIQPFGIYTMNGLWYCQAYNFSTGKHRVYRVDRVHSLSVSDDQTDVITSDREPIDRWILRPVDDESLLLQVELTEEGVRRCRIDPWLAESLHVKEDGSGEVRKPMGQNFLPWAARFFLGFGTDAQVLGPAALVERIRAELILMAQRYSLHTEVPDEQRSQQNS